MKPFQWKRFFTISGSLAGILSLVTIISTYLFNQSVPDDCPSCGMGAVGLVPLWIITAVAVITILVGFLTWAYARIQNRVLKTLYFLFFAALFIAGSVWLFMEM